MPAGLVALAFLDIRPGWPPVGLFYVGPRNFISCSRIDQNKLFVLS